MKLSKLKRKQICLANLSSRPRISVHGFHSSLCGASADASRYAKYENQNNHQMVTFLWHYRFWIDLFK